MSGGGSGVFLIVLVGSTPSFLDIFFFLQPYGVNL